jgi:ubiquinol-cytochrome c reductase core subunit 2
MNPSAVALDLAHAAAFHNGLGDPLYPSASTPIEPYLNESTIASFAETVYNKANIAVVVDGAAQVGLTKWIEAFFKSVPSTGSGKTTLTTAASKYYGGEQRTAQKGQNVMVIAFPGYALGSNKPESAVLTALLGGESSVKWSPGFTLLSRAAAAAPGAQVQANNLAYSDAGLMAIQISGSAAAVAKAAAESVKALKTVADGGITKEDLTKAIAKAKFDLLSSFEQRSVGLVAAGANLIHGGQPRQLAEAIKSMESVTVDKLKTVSILPW